MDGIFIVNESMDDVRRKRKGLVCKIDLEKANDKVD